MAGLDVAMPEHNPHPCPVQADSGALSATVVRLGTCCVVTLAGDVDMATVGRFHSAVGDEPTGPTDALIVDFSLVTFCGCSAVSYLLQLAERARARHARLAVVPCRHLNRVLEIVGLERTMPTYETCTEAIADTGCAEPRVG
ncbi:STAS domain-containing protein [Prauserella flavalba]|uniref:STAS domain-containing protein n=1 Tax=Prauserella flavalba TaxID=1477506 RepID=A0A318LAF2_9PSEU|nr:STAS domain-containing protein [Prauserella flavalba]PXY18698.1 hypothetical protein BA062_34375 [Prauserella flavalba]